MIKLQNLVIKIRANNFCIKVCEKWSEDKFEQRMKVPRITFDFIITKEMFIFIKSRQFLNLNSLNQTTS